MAREFINETRDRQEHVDRRLDHAIHQAREIFSLQLKTSESYLSLLWPKMPGAEWLAPDGASKTLKDVAGRLIDGGYDFEQLADGAEGLPDSHDPAFFAKFPYLDENFDYGRFGLLGLGTLVDKDQKFSPAANFYIYDGIRRTLVLARRLLTGQTRYEPVPALLVVPRPRH